MTAICNGINPYRRSSDDFYEEELHLVIDAATNLDKELCKQVAKVSFVFESTILSPLFHSEKMELQRNEKHDTKKRGQVLLTVAPAVLKQGRSDGEDFQTETTLLKSVVSCSYSDN